MLETPVFIKVPSVYLVKLPHAWINLAQICQVKLGDSPGKLIVIWQTGEFDIFVGGEAIALLSALEETTHIDKSNSQGGDAIA